MKKIVFYISLLLPLALIVYGLWSKNFSTSFAMVTILSLMFSAYAYFEISDMGPKEIALIATLSAFSGVMRVPFAAFPNIKPCTFIIAVSGYVFGPYKGALIGMNTALISNMFFGQGPWTPWQMLSWGIVGMLSGLIGKRHQAKGKVMKLEYFALMCFGYGIMFDWIMDLWYVVGYIKPLTPAKIFIAYLSGFVFDIMHGAGSFVFAIFFYEPMYKIFMRFKRRFEISYIKN